MAAYDSRSCELFLMPDLPEAAPFDQLKRIMLQIRPAVVVTSCFQDERLLEILRGKKRIS